MAANIQEAIDEVVLDIGSPAIIPTLPARTQTWIDEMFTAASFNPPGDFWDNNTAEQRSVFDWVVPNLVAQNEILIIGNNQLAQNVLINVVLRTLLATQAAQIAGRITADQETSVVTAYTNAWE